MVRTGEEKQGSVHVRVSSLHADGWRSVAGALLLLNTAALAGPVDDVRAAAWKVRDDLAAIHSAYEAVATRNAGQDDALLRLNLMGPGNKVLLRLDLHRRGNQIVWGAAWSTSQKWIHRVETTDLTVARHTSGHRISGRMTIHFVTADDIGPDATPARIPVKLNVAVAGNDVTGSFEAERASELQFVSSGAVENAGVAPMQSVPARPQALKMSEANSATVYLLCQAWEHHALMVAAHIRAIECARVDGKAVTDVFAEHPPRVPIRPADFNASSPPNAHGGKSAAAPPPKADDAPRDLDDIGGLRAADTAKEAGGKSDLDSVVTKTREDAPDVVSRRLAVVRHIVRHTERLLLSVRNQIESGGKADSFVNGTMTTDDPEFGPWYGFRSLPSRDGHANVVTADAGAEGPPLWLNVEDWRILGPFRGAAFAALHIPDVIDTEDAEYRMFANHEIRMSGTTKAAEISTPATNTWLPRACEPADGTVRPLQHSIGHGHDMDDPGMDYATYYFATTIWSDRDVELWAGFCIDDQGLLWINEQLACALPGPEKGTSIESVGMFRLRLRKGANTVIVREDNEVHSMGMWLRVCVRGTPRPAAEAKARMAEARERAAGLKAVPDEVRGWRGNWSGVYPDAAPPLAWDKEKRINVLWRARLGVGKGMPVIAGDRVIVASEPNFVTCLDKMTGRRLWEREMNTLELKDPKLYAESQALLKAWKDAEAELFALENEPAAADKGNERGKQLGGMASSGRVKWWDFVCKNGGMRKGPSVWGGFLGLNMATPVTDGKRVWVKCAAGVTACFDADGNRAWMVPTDFPGGGITIFSSPVLLDGKLIFELPTEEVAKGEGTCKKERVLKMVCFDGATGKPLWEARPVFNMQNGSSPAPMRLTNGREDMAVVVTGGGRGPEARKGEYNELLHMGGTVVRADDGRILIENLGVSSTWSSPIVEGDRIYHIGMLYSTCTRLVMVNRDLVGAIRLWTADTCGHDGGVVANGDLLTGLDGGQWPGMVHYYDRETGGEIRKTVNVNTVFSKFGRGYCPPSLVGGHLFISDAGSGFGWTPRTTKMFVVQPGRKGRLVARNDLEPDMVPAPAYDGDRMYARTAGALTCIGYTGDQGRAYEAEVVARTLMEDIPPAPPKAGAEKHIRALPGLPVGVSAFSSVPAHQTWHFVGPYPASESNTILSAMGGPALEGYRPGTNRNESGVKDLYMDVWNNRKFSVRRASQMLDLTAPIECQANTMAIYYWAFEVTQPRLVRVIADRPDVDLWVSGNRVVDQDRIKLAAGRHVVTIRFITADTDTPPPQTLMDLRLIDSPDASDDIRAWREAVESNRAILDRVIKLCPDSETAKEAKARLSGL